MYRTIGYNPTSNQAQDSSCKQGVSLTVCKNPATPVVWVYWKGSVRRFSAVAIMSVEHLVEDYSVMAEGGSLTRE